MLLGLYDHVLEALSPDVSPASMAAILRLWKRQERMLLEHGHIAPNTYNNPVIPTMNAFDNTHPASKATHSVWLPSLYHFGHSSMDILQLFNILLELWCPELDIVLQIISTSQRLTNSGNVLIGSPYDIAPAMVMQTHITEATSWIPGDRKRDRDFMESDFSESKRSKKEDKNGKGLRHFSMKVCEKVQCKGTTSYNEVADELVSEFTNPNNHIATDSAYDQKNIRRRVYDALNVLMAMNIISKEKKEIKWIGLPTNSAQECQNLEREKQQRIERIRQKRTQLQELLLQQIAFKNLVQRNQHSEQHTRGPPAVNSTIQVPFLIINTSKRTVIDCSISSDKFEYLFNFDNMFQIHNYTEMLNQMGMSFGLEAGKCSPEDLRTAKSLVPKALEKYLTDMSTGICWVNQELVLDSAQSGSTLDTAGDSAVLKSSSANPGLCLDAEVGLAAEQLLIHSSQQSSSATSHYSESCGETPCSFSDVED